MIILLVISYFFLVLSSGIQSLFAKAYKSPEEAPVYFSTPLKLIPTLFTYIVTYIHFNALFTFDINIFLKLVIHVIIVLISSAIAQAIYVNTNGLTKDSPLHVLSSIIIGSVLLGIWYFLS